MDYPNILHHGAKDGVTGSCHQLLMDGQHSLLIDCGLFQGAETSPEGKSGAERLAIEFPLDSIEALIATHVHIDHVGRIPYLLAAGFKGPILCSEPSAKLLPIVLEDAFKLGFSRDQKQVERYIKLIEQRIIALPYKTWFTLQDTESLNCRIRLQRAGHILGSAYVEIDLRYPQSGEKKRIVFSGDLGAPHAPLLPAPKPPYRADILVIESTYGDRLHEDRRSRRQRLENVIEQALADNGTVLIPAFSIGRTQELLYELEDIIHRKLNADGKKGQRSRAAFNSPLPVRGMSRDAGARVALSSPLPPGEGLGVRDGVHRGRKDNPPNNAAPTINWPQLPIILDSPLASRFTQVYRDLKPFWDNEALQRVKQGRNPLGFEQLLTVDSHQAHLAMVRHLTETARPAIVIAGNGMCSSGRIVNYLKAMLHDARHNVLFVGYQAQGTPGRTIQGYGPRGGYVELDGQRYDIRAQVHTIGGYSAHADQKGLVNFVTRMREWPSEVRIVHGEPGAKNMLAKRLQDTYADKGLPLQVTIPS
ncbi:MBL fold metallo-hydrolase RNA specificity domain-containing protein [Pseudomonas sp. UBA2684]|uniref:MBL fold metallo-hydrolase RNA specificity domain-containing protein n=1 Tax=Pseudomonas sp. UBA2684 TaxID=1947311 RepID=UPI0025E1D8FF|nr:MBL fold metallo-hydrolase [Pseudomonas sp. UBA2684]|tara:strand:- start:22760 stop:24358 length:1599 start_codon:yes stop_codon:yes gene_type:complete